MNKRIKRIISLALTIGTFSAIAPTNHLNLFTTKAYAYSTSDDVAFLKDIDVNHGSLNFSKTRTSYDINLDRDVDSIDIAAVPEESSYDVTVDGTSKIGTCTKTVALNKGRNKIIIKSDDSGDNGPITYYVNVYRGSTSTSSSDDEDDEVYLDDITLSDGDITFSRSKNSYNVNVAQSVSTIRVTANPENEDDDVVTINGVSVDGEDKYRKTVSLNNGKNVVTIVVEDNDGENGNTQTYILNINRGGTTATTTATTGEIDDNQDDIYLDDIVLEDGAVPISFRPKVTSYAVDVKEDWEDIVVKAAPEDDDRIVRINGDKLSYDGKFRKTLALKEGKNVFQIKVNNDDEYDSDDDSHDAVKYKQRIYTLTVYRGTSEGTAASINNSNASTNNNVNVTAKINQWVNNNGKWQYNDILGNTLKNMWFLDKNYGAWYYLDELGNMKTGWIQDGTGRWYYLYPSGAMAYNTTIDGCKLGSDGAWVK